VKTGVKEKVIFEELDGEVVLLELGSGQYYKLNRSGSHIWSLIREHGDTELVEQALAAEYQIDRDRAHEDVAELVGQLESLGLIVVDRP
jgi:hypothetical protein